MYQLTRSGVLRLADGAFVPADLANADWLAYLAWWEAGGNPVPAPAPPVVTPQVVSRFQAKAALMQIGRLAQVEALMADPDTPALARLVWAEGIEVRRASPTVAAMGQALGLTDADLDALFTLAAGIEA